MKKLRTRYQLEAKSLSLNKLLFTKTKRIKSSKKFADTKHVFFNMVIVEAIQSRIALLATSIMIIICIISILTKTNKLTILLVIRLWRWSSKDDEGRGLTRAITESRTTFTAFLQITLTSLLTSLLFTVLQAADLLGSPVN